MGWARRCARSGGKLRYSYLIGEPRVNVLELNLALDRLKSS
jgi:K+-transporting ATPase c subunit